MGLGILWRGERVGDSRILVEVGIEMEQRRSRRKRGEWRTRGERGIMRRGDASGK